MRVKRQKTIRRHLSFYKHHYGFREPYQVLVDGNFCHVALEMKVHIKQQLQSALGGQTKELTTRCVHEELRKLGPKFHGAGLIAKQFEVRRCSHTEAVPAHECLASLVADGNVHHYMVATQDVSLRQRLRQSTAVPLIYLQLNVPLLEPPSATSIQHAKELEKRKLMPTEVERKTLVKDASDADQQQHKRRRKPAGPNPKATLKKKKKATPSAQASPSPKQASPSPKRHKPLPADSDA